MEIAIILNSGVPVTRKISADKVICADGGFLLSPVLEFLPFLNFTAMKYPHFNMLKYLHFNKMKYPMLYLDKVKF